jgi:exoribonuclease-2
MNLFFEESGDFKVGTMMSQAGEAYQVEMASGKRTKVKTKDVLLQYEKPAPAELMEQATALPSWAPNTSATRRCPPKRRA